MGEKYKGYIPPEWLDRHGVENAFTHEEIDLSRENSFTEASLHISEGNILHGIGIMYDLAGYDVYRSEESPTNEALAQRADRSLGKIRQILGIDTK